MLAYVLLSDQPPARHRLASLLFAEAVDPLAALRWSLAELRRALGSHATLGGDPVRLALRPGVSVDVLDVQEGCWPDSGVVPGELLESAYFNSCPGFEAWLLVARRRLAMLVDAVLVDRVHRFLDAGSYDAALDSAAQLVELNPLDERHQTLLVRCLAHSGDQAAAEKQLAAAAALLSNELGVEPSESLRIASTEQRGGGLNPGAATVRAMIDAGRAAIAAGAADAAVLCLRSAVADAEAGPDRVLLAQALTSFGAALQRLGTSVDDAEPALRRGLAVAQEAGDQASLIVAHRELGFLHAQAGSHVDSDQHLAKAASLAVGDDSQLASILGIQGMSLSDRARYPEALEVLDEAVARARRCDRHRKEAWALAMLGRVHLVRHDIGPAADALDESLRIARLDRWLAFLAWPEILGADIDLTLGHTNDARGRLDHAHTLASHLSDTGLQALATRGLGLIAAHTGDPRTALHLVDQARRHAFGGSRTYVWIQAQVAATRSELLIGTNAPTALDAVREWIELASRAGLQESIVRAHLAAARLGQPGARSAAQAFTTEIDNPALHALPDWR